MKQSCSNCRFWANPNDDEDDDTRMGECRRYPPRICEAMMAADIANAYGEPAIGLERKTNWLNTTFPVTGDDEWCGEWQSDDGGARG